MLPAISQLHFCSWLNIFFFPSNPPCLLFNCGGAILKRNSEVSYFLLAKILTQNSLFFCKLLRITFHSCSILKTKSPDFRVKTSNIFWTSNVILNSVSRQDIYSLSKNLLCKIESLLPCGFFNLMIVIWCHRDL